MTIRTALLTLSGLLLASSEAAAHYLWVVVENTQGERAANVYFEEGPAARDGEYMDHFAGSSKTWVRTVKEIEPQLLETADTRADDKRWLRAPLAAETPLGVEAYGKFGVYLYGDTPVLLHYYARWLDVADHDDLHELGRAEHLDLDIVPHDHGDEMQLTVLWKGEPAGNRTVHIRGPERFQQNLTTNERGRVEFTPPAAGRYTFRTSVEEATPGRDGEDEYELIRHNGTLVMNLPVGQ